MGRIGEASNSDTDGWRTVDSVTSKNLPNVYESCPKMISLEKLKILTPSQKLPKNVGDLGKPIVATGLEKLPKVQIIAQSGHTDCEPCL